MASLSFDAGYYAHSNDDTLPVSMPGLASTMSSDEYEMAKASNVPRRTTNFHSGVKLESFPTKMRELIQAKFFKAKPTGHTGQVMESSDEELTVADISQLLSELRRTKQRNKFYRFTSVGAIIFTFILLLCGGITTYAVVTLTKDMKINQDLSDPVLRTTKDGSAVQTIIAQSYVGIQDITSLSMTALNSIDKITFTTASGVHTYQPSGVSLFANQNKVVMMFSEQYSLTIQDGEGMFYSPSVPSGEKILLPSNTAVSGRRRLLAQTQEDTGSGQCSVAGVCYHSWVGMMAVLGRDANGNALPQHSVQGRMLVDDTHTPGLPLYPSDPMGYVKVTNMDSVQHMQDATAVSQADGFLKALLGDNYTSIVQTDNQRVQLQFTIQDRCKNYPGLVMCGIATPVSSSDSNHESVLPYPGLTANEGSWWFHDEITYEKDKRGYKISIRYAHDPFRDNRQHVMVQMDQSDGTEKFWSWDEVDMDGTHRQTFCSTDPKSRANSNQPLGGRRLFEAATSAERFHAKVRDRIAGFGHVDINLDSIFSNHRNNQGMPGRRLLQVDAETAVEFTVPESSNADGHTVWGQSRLDSLFNDTADYNKQAGNSTTHGLNCPVKLPSSVKASEPTSLYGLPTVTVIVGFIPVPDFEHCETTDIRFVGGVPVRSELHREFALGRDNSTVPTPTGTGGRRLVADEAHNTRMEHKTRHGKLLASMVQKGHEALDNIGQKIGNVNTGISAHHEQKKQRQEERKMAAGDSISVRSRRKGKRGLRDDQCDFFFDWDFRRKVDAQDGSVNLFDYTTYPQGTSNECKNMRTEVVDKTYTDVKSFIDGPLATVDELTGTILDGFEMAQEIMEALELIADAMKAGIPIASLCGFIPYVGPAFNAFSKALSTAKKFMDPIIAKVKSFVDFLEKYEVEDVVCNTSHWNDEIGYYLTKTAVLEAKYIRATLSVDRLSCGSPSVGKFCSLVASKHKYFNDLTASVLNAINNIASIFKVPKMVLDVFVSLSTTSVWKAFTKFFQFLSILFKPFTDFLNRKISITAPIPGWATKSVCVDLKYPCGTNTCKKYGVKYPCGVKYCSKSVCSDVGYPTVTMTKFSYTVGDIVMGVFSVISTVKDLLNKGVENLLAELHLSLPDLVFMIPGLNFLFNSVGFDPFPSFPAIPAINTTALEDKVCGAVETTWNGMYEVLDAVTNTNIKI